MQPSSHQRCWGSKALKCSQLYRFFLVGPVDCIYTADIPKTKNSLGLSGVFGSLFDGVFVGFYLDHIKPIDRGFDYRSWSLQDVFWEGTQLG